MSTPLLDQYREFLKDTIRQRVDFSQTDQSRGVVPPPLEKPFAAEAARIKLMGPAEWRGIEPVELLTAIQNRRSRRQFTDKPFSLDELSLSALGYPGRPPTARPGHGPAHGPFGRSAARPGDLPLRFQR